MSMVAFQADTHTRNFRQIFVFFTISSNFLQKNFAKFLIFVIFSNFGEILNNFENSEKFRKISKKFLAMHYNRKTLRFLYLEIWGNERQNHLGENFVHGEIFFVNVRYRSNLRTW